MIKFMHLIKLFLCMALSVAMLAACDRGSDGVPAVSADFIETEDPNRFLLFLNQQAGLPPGRYTIVAATFAVGESGDFRIGVELDDGSLLSFNGSWVSSGGMDETSVDNPRFDFTMPHTGGAIIGITADVQTCLYLLDSGGSVVAGQQGVDLCTNPQVINLAPSKINTAENAAAYYQAIDPLGTRTTLQDWITANGFGQPCGAINPCEVHVIFRDTRDLGYGRSMFVRRSDDGSVAIYVENFQVDAVPGLQYTELNLDAAIDDARRWHFGSNAIEFSTYPYGLGEPRDGEITFATTGGQAPLFTKFYSFVPDEPADPNTVERLSLTVDLDERGEKSMPGPCISCHGGKSRPLLPDGTLPPPIPGGVPGDLQAQLQPIEVNTLGFSEEPGYTRADLEAGLRFINQAVLDSYRIVNEQYTGVQGYWNSDAAAEVLKGWYGGNTADPMDYTLPANAFNEDYVPLAWRPNVNTNNPPAGADTLFKEVVGPNCLVCHSKRGTDKQSDIDFSSYAKFIGHAAQIEDFVYDRGIMPMGLLNFDEFWDNSAPGKAELLAGFIPGFSHQNTDGTAQQPGRPIAVIAAPANTNVPITLSGEGSYFSDSYQWRIVSSPAGSSPTLSGIDTARPVFNTDIDGAYQIELTASGSAAQDTEVVTITVNSALPVPTAIRFNPDIRTVLQANPLGTTCVSCHAAAGEPGVPVYYTDAQVEGRELYAEVISRVNFKEPLDSLLLSKPAGNHHFGNLIDGFDLGGGDRTNYDLFLAWILEGAPR